MIESNRKWHLWMLVGLLAAACAPPIEVGGGAPEGPDLSGIMKLVDDNDLVDDIDDGEPFTLNLADQDQLRFVERQLIDAGLIDQERDSDLAAALTAARAAPDQQLTLMQMEEAEGTWRPLAMITHLDQPGDDRRRAGALYSVSGTVRAVLLLQLFDAVGQPIGEPAVVDDWLQDHLTLEVEAVADTPGVSAVFTYFYATFDAPGGTAQVIIKSLADDAASNSDGLNTASTDFSGINPRKLDASATCTFNSTSTGVTRCIRVCNAPKRAGSNCDYDVNVSSVQRELEVSGTVSLPSNVTGGLSNVQQTLSRTAGGGCKTSIPYTNFDNKCPPGGSKVFGVSGKEVCWNAGKSIFATNTGCWSPDVGYQVNYYTLSFQATLAGQDKIITVSSSTGAPATGACNQASAETCLIPPILFVWGCLPEGTPVRMADGSLKPIEEVEVEEMVLADAGGRTLRVVDTFWGTEDKPLVVIEDDRGNVLEATENHPIFTAGGVMLAKQVRAGDVLMTEAGPSTVRSTAPGRTGAKVWNLALGGDGETPTGDDTTHFAGGILVGDHRMQGIYERRYETRVDHGDAIPEQWRRDYRQWLEQQEESAAADRAQ